MSYVFYSVHMLYLYWIQSEGENPISWKKEKDNNKFM